MVVVVVVGVHGSSSSSTTRVRDTSTRSLSRLCVFLHGYFRTKDYIQELGPC
jgi:hypothetical protein